MNKWDDSMSAYSTELKLKLQNQLFSEIEYKNKSMPEDGYMCSEVIIVALQNAWEINSIADLPSSLKLDPILCPPSTLMLALRQDQRHFQIVGEIEVPDYNVK